MDLDHLALPESFLHEHSASLGALQLPGPGVPTRDDLLWVGGRTIQKRKGSVMLLLCEIQTCQEKQRHMEGHWESLIFKVWN